MIDILAILMVILHPCTRLTITQTQIYIFTMKYTLNEVLWHVYRTVMMRRMVILGLNKLLRPDAEKEAGEAVMLTMVCSETLEMKNAAKATKQLNANMLHVEYQLIGTEGSSS